MKIIVIGATGTIGRAVADLLRQSHEVVAVSRSGEHRADIRDKASLDTLFAAVGPVDAIVCAAGGAVFKPFAELSDADFKTCLDDKLMGQVDVVRRGAAHVVQGGSITITSGMLAQTPMRARQAWHAKSAGTPRPPSASSIPGSKASRGRPPWSWRARACASMSSARPG